MKKIGNVIGVFSLTCFVLFSCASNSSNNAAMSNKADLKIDLPHWLVRGMTQEQIKKNLNEHLNNRDNYFYYVKDGIMYAFYTDSNGFLNRYHIMTKSLNKKMYYLI